MNTSIIWLNGNEEGIGYLAIEASEQLLLWDEQDAFEKTKTFMDQQHGSYLFGWFGYDLKNDIERLRSNNPQWVKTPLVYLMKPRHLAKIKNGVLEIIYGDEGVLKEEYGLLVEGHSKDIMGNVEFRPSEEREQYLSKIEKVKEHIQRGDIYEANYCYEFKGEGSFDTLATYHQLNGLTKAPFSVYAKIPELTVLCASPERFVKKEGNKVTTQPIKGTIKRGNSKEEDEALKKQLRQNPKDRSENIMIVDLVRNDLSRIAAPSSVQVEELCEIYTFENIHQMISTVSAKVEKEHSLDIIKAMFPMGSMTGAPKIRAMQIIEDLEESKRGLYSGCIGYFTPENDFDFNVVIRSILYDEQKKRVSFSVGGAITDLSTAEGEYEETILKAKALKQALSS